MAERSGFLEGLKILAFPRGGHPVAATAAREAKALFAPAAEIREGWEESGPGVFLFLPGRPDLCGSGQEARLAWDGKAGGFLASRSPRGFYAAFLHFFQAGGVVPPGGAGWRPAFEIQRTVFDLFLNQYYRDLPGWDREELVRETARAGYTHLEVNGLAGPPAEKGVPGEVLHRFYTYCPALDQFAESSLNRGTYPKEYLEANLARLVENARLAEKYGLTPGLLCFEPRSVPESLLERYPTLRGCRVDHPFRSFLPRFNLTTAHPAVLDHYRELLGRILERVPGLGFLEIWSNDSGAAFEHTASLYAGRNGGAYLIREWKGHEEIARAAAGNILRFMRALRDAGRRVNPEFRVILRIEPFETERTYLEEGLEEGLELSGLSVLGKGWDLPYAHPVYEDVRSVGGTLWQTGCLPGEGRRAAELEKRGSGFHALHAAGLFGNLEPLTGIPFPFLLWEKLEAWAAAGIRKVGFLGGAAPARFEPYPVNREALRAFQAGGERDLEMVLARLGREWAGRERERLVRAWRLLDRVLRAFPVPVHLYAIYGFVWYRLWTRPLVPDIEAIPEEERAYYEKEMLTTPHNPNRVDLARDVLFRLCRPKEAGKAVERMDQGVFPALAEVREFLEGCPGEGAFLDLQERTAALECWMETQRNTAAWIAGVHGWTEGRDPAARDRVREAVIRERRNTERLIRLWRERKVEFMAAAPGKGDTFLYGGGDFEAHLERRLALMEGREDDEPRVDPGFLWRLPDLEAWRG